MGRADQISEGLVLCSGAGLPQSMVSMKISVMSHCESVV
jgi:hypothetical protein